MKAKGPHRHSPPAVAYPLSAVPKGLWLVFGLSLLGSLGWGVPLGLKIYQICVQNHESLASYWAYFLVLAGMVSLYLALGVCFWVASFKPRGKICWTDQKCWEWHLSSTAKVTALTESGGKTEGIPGREAGYARLSLDWQKGMLLRWYTLQGQAKAWLWVCQSTSPPHWKALRRAVYFSKQERVPAVV